MKARWVLALFLVAVALAGCGGGAGSSSTPAPTPTPTPAPSKVTATCVTQIQIGVVSANYTCTAGEAVAWNVDNAVLATISSAGILTPNNTTTGTVTVTATATTGSDTPATVKVQVVDWILNHVLREGYAGWVSIVSGDGTWVSYLFYNNGPACGALAFAPDHLSFMCADGTAAGAIDIFNTDGTAAGTTQVESIDLVALGGAENEDPLTPHFSPDGKTIVFMSGIGSGVMGTFTVDKGGKSPPVLVYSAPPSGYYNPNERFTPDGRQITTWNPATQTVWILNADGTNPHQLIPTTSYDVIFSPDMTRLYYNAPDGVYVANPDGSNPANIAAYGSVAGCPGGYNILDVSPNGKSILLSLYTGDASQQCETGTYNLYTADAVTGANVREILPNAGVGSWGN